MYNLENEKSIEIENRSNLVDFLKKSMLSRFLKENPENYDFPDVVEGFIAKTLEYPKIIKSELTGSMARFASGFGSFERYFQGKDGAKNLLENLEPNKLESPDNYLRKIAKSLAESEYDIDLCFRFENGESLSGLYGFLNNKFENNKSFIKDSKEIGFKNEKLYVNSFSVSLNDKYLVSVVHEPIITNPRFKKMTMHFITNLEGEKKEIMHVDVSEFPKNGVEAREQKRHGGRTVASQDKCRLELRAVNNKIYYEITDSAKTSLFGQESIDIAGKDLPGIMELALRSLRIRLIHTPERTPFKIDNISNIVNTKTLFAIRKRIEHLAIDNHINISPKDLYLPLKDLILSFNYDPYTTLQFLQDTNLYVLFPGLRNLSGKDWRSLYLNEWLNLSMEGGMFMSPEKRQLGSLIKDQKEYNDRHLTNGFTLFLRAIHEVKNSKIIEFDMEQEFNLLISGKAPYFDREKLVADSPTKTLINILNNFKGGLTEVELHRMYTNLTLNKISEKNFRKILREIKFSSMLDKQLRKIRVHGADRSVMLYASRIPAKETPFKLMIDLMSKKWNKNTPHPYFNRAREYSLMNNAVSDNILFEKIVNSMKHFGIRSLEALRSLSHKDFNDLYEESGIAEVDLKDFQSVCRTLQIISEDILRHPQFLR